MTPNLAYLEKQWLHPTGAQRAFGHRRSRTPEELKTLLRHHGEATVYGDEVEYRDDFDRLMMFYSVLEIGIMIGFVDELPEAFRKKHLGMLADPAVRHYYEWNYPLDLPRRLRERLQTGFGISVARTRELTALFYEFLELTKLLERDEELESFRWALDDGYNEIGISHIRTALKRPERLLQAVLKKPDRRTVLDKALSGFCKFIQFCQGFERLLQRVPNRVVAEALWLAHAYWFRRFGLQIGGNLKSVFRKIAAWQVATKSKKRLDRRVKELDGTITSLSVSPLSKKPLHLALGVETGEGTGIQPNQTDAPK